METSSLLIFLILSVLIVFFSRKQIINPGSHGFYRFFSWIGIAWLISNNYPYWFTDIYSPKQIISWLLLISAVYPAISGAILIIKRGKPGKSRIQEELFSFEITTRLVDTGIYKYIRHPLYGSLILLTWGIYFKNTEISLFIISIASSLFLYKTAKVDEKECIEYFNGEYLEYMGRSKMFIPFIF